MMNNQHAPVITLDGPSGTGKGTLCHRLAEHLGWHFLDSGAIYRVLGFAVKKHAIAFTNIPALVQQANTLELHFEVGAHQTSIVYFEKEDISQAIRSEQCGQDASIVAAIPEVRDALLARQRAFAKKPGLVTDGRDMGTVVFPDAILKIYLFASAEERAQRRYLQLKNAGNNVSLAQVVDELTKRDARDTARSRSPLKPADDAVLVDTTGLSIENVLQTVLQLVNERWCK